MITTHDQGAWRPGELLLPDAEAARRLGISVATLKRWQRRGRLAELKVGTRNFVAASQLQSFVESITQQALRAA